MPTRCWWTAPMLGGCLLVAVLSAEGVRGQDKPPATVDRTELDSAIYKTLRTVINQGADLYNSGNWGGCYRLYEGSLLTVRPLLGHRPELKREIDDALVNAARSPQEADRAFVLRKVIDKIRAETAPVVVAPTPRPPPVAQKKETLWDRLGGEKGVTRIVDIFMATTLSDPKVNFYRRPTYIPSDEQIKELKRKMVEWLSSMTAGTLDYKGKTMREAHKGMGITSAEFDAMVGHIRSALVISGVKPEDMSLVLGLVETTRKDIVHPLPPPPPATVWQRIGGEAGATRIVDDFLTAAIADPMVNFFRDPKYVPTKEEIARLKLNFVDQLSQLTGGPLTYKGRNMKQVHSGYAITPREFDVFLGHIRMALDRNKVSAADIRTIMDKYEGFRKDIVSMPSAPVEPPNPNQKKPGETTTPDQKKPGELEPIKKKPEEKKPEEGLEPIKKKPELKPG